MQNDVSDVSLDELSVDEEELRQPTLFPVSIVSCQTKFVKPVDNVLNLKNSLMKELKGKYAFRTKERKRFKEGFLEFHSSSDNILNCYFAKETPTKIVYEANDLKLHNKRMRLINPAFSVKIKIVLSRDDANVVMFGGSEAIMGTALEQINICIRDVIKGGHITVRPGFTRREMNTILKSFGVNVEYIWIHPGESVRFMKMVERKIGGEIKKIPEYIVHAKLHGYHITGSPITIQLIDESGVDLKEIQGKFEYGVKLNITSRVSSSGKILFYIPENIIGAESTAYDVAEILYSRVTQPSESPKQKSLGEYFPEES